MKTIFFLLLVVACVEFVYHPSGEEFSTQTIKPLNVQLPKFTRERVTLLDKVNKFQKYKEPQLEEFYTADLGEKDSLTGPAPSLEAGSSFRAAILLQTFAITTFLIGAVLLLWYFFIYKPHSPLPIALETPPLPTEVLTKETPSLPTEAPAFIPVEKSPPVVVEDLLKKQIIAISNRQNDFLNTHHDMLKNMITVIDKHWQQKPLKEKKSIVFLKASQAALQDYLAYCHQYHQYVTYSVKYPLEKTLSYDDWSLSDESPDIPFFSFTPSTEKLLIFHPVLYCFHQPDECYPFHIGKLVHMTGLMMASEESAKAVLQYLSGKDVYHFKYTFGDNTIDYFSPYKNTMAAQPTEA